LQGKEKEGKKKKKDQKTINSENDAISENLCGIYSLE
jgi:hypothetical protein